VRTDRSHALERIASSPAGWTDPAGARPIQRVVKFTGATVYLDPAQNAQITNSAYRAVIDSAKSIEVEIKEETALKSAARYVPVENLAEGVVEVAPRSNDELNSPAAFNNRLAQVAHEMRHALDDLVKPRIGIRGGGEQRIHSEFRAFATEAAVSMNAKNSGEKINPAQDLLIGCFASTDAFKSSNGMVFTRLALYLPEYKVAATPAEFLNAHPAWIDEALALFRSLAPPQVVVTAGWRAYLPSVTVGTTVVLAVVLAALAYRLLR
jgi:hypothetical protein